MGFWIIMVNVNLLIPCIMIIFGNYFFKTPGEINMAFGYRTSMSMKSRETWEFAHHYCGKLWRTVGLLMLVPSVAAMFFVIGKDANTVGIFALILCCVQSVCLIAPIIPTEAALKKNFDAGGDRRK